MFAAAVLNELCDAYGIGRPMLTSSFLQNESNRNYTLVTTEGYYTVVCIDQERSLRAIGCEHQFMRYLRQNGFPTPSLLPTRYGTTVALVRGQLYVLLTASQGAAYDPQEPQHLHGAAAALSMFHRLADGFSYPPPSESDSSLDYLHDQGEGMLVALERSIAGSTPLKRHKIIHHILASLHHTLSHLQDELRSVTSNALPQTIIHGSYTPEALIFEDMVLTTVYGYEHARYAPRLLDLGYALATFGCDYDIMSRVMTLDVDALRSFLAIYCEHYELHTCERDLLPLVLRYAWLNTGLRRCTNACLTASSDEVASTFKGLQQEMGWLDEHAKSLVGDRSAMVLAEIAVMA